MNEFDTRDRRGAHRMQRGPLQALVPGLLAVAAVAALVVAVLVMRGTAPSTTVAAGATSSPQASTTASVAATPTATGSASSTPSGAASPDGTTAPTDDASPTPSATATDSTGSGDVKSSASVVVLNQTRISGLAGRVAQTLRDAGWTVASTGNFSGNVPATTVYYPDGMQAAAEALAADVPGPDRVRPRFGNLSKDKLTVIVTSAAG